jgi:hypothetical protein
MLVTAGSWNTEATGEGLRAGEYTGRAPKAGTRPAAHNTHFCDRASSQFCERGPEDTSYLVSAVHGGSRGYRLCRVHPHALHQVPTVTAVLWPLVVLP